LLGGTLVITVWALLEAGRWRIKYRRLLAARQSSTPASRSKPISKLLAEGKGLQADVGSVIVALGAWRASHPMTGALPGKIARWEGSVSETLAKQPEILDLFRNAPEVDAARPLAFQAYSRIEYQIKVLENIAANHASDSKPASDQKMSPTSRVQAALEAHFTKRASRLYELYEQGQKLRATLGSNGKLKDLGNPDLVDNINRWQSSVEGALIYWPDQYIQNSNVRRTLIYEFTDVLGASEQIGRELSILHSAMRQANSHPS
jgi:hypothetical protein